MHSRAVPHGMGIPQRDLDMVVTLDGLASLEGALTSLPGDEVGSAVVLAAAPT